MPRMHIERRSSPLSAIRLAILAALLCLVPATRVLADVVAGFQDLEVVSGLSQPAALGFAPDGRLFFTEKASGRVRVIKNGALLDAPFFDANDVIQPPAYFDSFLERGMLGIAFDPDFATTQYVYLYYSICKVPGSGMCQTAKNRVVRVTAGYQGSPDQADPTSQVILLDDIDNDAGSHNAGWLGFGPLDGKLYVSVGDGGSDPHQGAGPRIAERQDPAAERGRHHPRRQSVRRPVRRTSGGAGRSGSAIRGDVASTPTDASSAATSASRRRRRSTSWSRAATTAGR